MRLGGLKALRRQRGTVLITVVLIAAFVIVLVMQSIKTVRYQKQLSSNLINRDQAYSYLMGMEELAKIWLKKAFAKSKDKNVHLNQPWAQQDITFPIDGGGMTASIKDMQSCFNLNSVLLSADDIDAGSGTKTQTGGGQNLPSPQRPPAGEGQFAGDKTPGQEVFEELFNRVNEDTETTGQALAAALRDWIDADLEPNGPDGAEDDYYQIMQPAYRTGNTLIAHASELRAMKDFSSKIYTALLPHVCVLPDPSVNQINVNTVSQDSTALMMAILSSRNMSESKVSEALNNGGEKGYEKIEDFFDALGAKEQINNKEMLTVTSDYFQMRAKAEIGNTRVAMKTLFKRDSDNNFRVVSRYIGKE